MRRAAGGKARRTSLNMLDAAYAPPAPGEDQRLPPADHRSLRGDPSGRSAATPGSAPFGREDALADGWLVRASNWASRRWTGLYSGGWPCSATCPRCTRRKDGRRRRRLGGVVTGLRARLVCRWRRLRARARPGASRRTDGTTATHTPRGGHDPRRGTRPRSVVCLRPEWVPCRSGPSPAGL